jgi:hypothetical protein
LHAFSHPAGFAKIDAVANTPDLFESIDQPKSLVTTATCRLFIPEHARKWEISDSAASGVWLRVGIQIGKSRVRYSFILGQQAISLCAGFEKFARPTRDRQLTRLQML